MWIGFSAHRDFREKVTTPLTDVAGREIDSSKWHIQANYSEKQATITATQSARNIHIAGLASWSFSTEEALPMIADGLHSEATSMPPEIGAKKEEDESPNDEGSCDGEALAIKDEYGGQISEKLMAQPVPLTKDELDVAPKLDPSLASRLRQAKSSTAAADLLQVAAATTPAGAPIGATAEGSDADDSGDAGGLAEAFECRLSLEALLSKEMETQCSPDGRGHDSDSDCSPRSGRKVT